MDRERINIGDEVLVGWVGGEELRGIVRHYPCDVGDMWRIEGGGRLWAINPISQSLEYICKKIDTTPES